MNDQDYLDRIDSARVYDVATETPLELASGLSARIANRVLMKREDLQPVFSFKLRGAYNKIASLPDDEIANGVICSSAGNHAQGLALANRLFGDSAHFVMPEPVNVGKRARVENGVRKLPWCSSVRKARQ